MAASAVPKVSYTQLSVADACEAFVESRRPYIAAKTYHEYKLNAKTLGLFFGAVRIHEVDGDLVRAFQRARKLNCGASGINHECGLLCQVRKRIGMPLEDYQPLPLPKEKPGRALSDAERERLVRVASSNPNWQAAYLFAVISVNTTAGPKEIASLRFKDIDWDREEIRIPPHGAKNISRVRSIPLNSAAIAAVKLAVERAKSLGSTDPDHYLFPFGTNRRCDPRRPQTTFKTAWKKITTAALLGGLQMYDLRRTAITNLLENPEVSDETIEEIAGHTPGSSTKKRYSYIRKEARRKAVEILAPKKPAAAIKGKMRKTKLERSAERERIVEQLGELLAKLLKSG